MRCCIECFSDRILRQKIAREGSNGGYCELCATSRTVRIECSLLTSDLSILLSVYAESTAGEDLLDLVNRDWEIFSSSVKDKSSLLEALLPGIVGRKFVTRTSAASSPESRWLELKRELKYENRFFPASAPDRDELSELLGLLVISQEDEARTFFRARVQKDKASLSLGDLKAPPSDLVGAGRANPPGLSYLYVASDAGTAISEVRPTVADVVTVAKFVSNRPFKLVDLSEPRSLISPFALDLGALSNVQASMGLLTMLSEDLTKPAPPHTAAYDYLPTQYLCELIKTLGYDGVKYRSSLNAGGNNFAFFDVEALSPVDLEAPVRVAEVKLAIE